MSAHPYDEGHTVAGWTGTAVATAGTSVTALGVIGWAPGIWLGLAITAAALLVTWALHLAGWGKPPGLRPVDQWGMRVRDDSARQGHAQCLGCRLAGRRPAPARAVHAVTLSPVAADLAP
ncbi:HGxxPAAW family protein [Streptomyces sp. NPDC058646]|uniref:HGxxPAAW family protein n=1 Tax=Streptomyces sp. NPDC058646 TaxID=3346574 RepID=UPI0036692874